MIETLAGRLENRREIPSCLGHNIPFNHLAGGPGLGRLTAEVEETTDFDRLAKRADRRREFGRDKLRSCSWQTPVDTRLDGQNGGAGGGGAPQIMQSQACRAQVDCRPRP